jgi:hypothetical protein
MTLVEFRRRLACLEKEVSPEQRNKILIRVFNGAGVLDYPESRDVTIEDDSGELVIHVGML